MASELRRRVGILSKEEIDEREREEVPVVKSRRTMSLVVCEQCVIFLFIVLCALTAWWLIDFVTFLRLQNAA